MESVEICCPPQHTIFKLLDIKQLIENEVNEITVNKWRRCVEHIIKVKLANVTDFVVDCLINNNAESSGGTSFDTHIEGIDLLSDSS